MDQINSEILRRFEAQGLTINEGIAVDARLVNSASRLISNDKIKEIRDKHNTPESKRNKNGKPLKFHKVRYIVEQYFGSSHLDDGAKRTRFADITKNKFDAWFRQAAINIARG
jgi:hypothetical protein